MPVSLQDSLEVIKKAFIEQDPGVTPIELRLKVHHLPTGSVFEPSLEAVYVYKEESFTRSFNLQYHKDPFSSTLRIRFPALVVPQLFMDYYANIS